MKVIVEKDVGWFDYAEQQTEFAMFDTLCRAYGVEVELVHDVAVFKKERVVVFEEKGTILLEDFIHDENAFYIFGRSCQDLTQLFPNAVTVRIDVPNPLPMFHISACSIALEDRRRKWLSQ